MGESKTLPGLGLSCRNIANMKFLRAIFIMVAIILMALLIFRAANSIQTKSRYDKMLSEIDRIIVDRSDKNDIVRRLVDLGFDCKFRKVGSFDSFLSQYQINDMIAKKFAGYFACSSNSIGLYGFVYVKYWFIELRIFIDQNNKINGFSHYLVDPMY